MLTWGSCISYRRYGYRSTDLTPNRSDFTRDYDRIIFSSAFRRLQNKTQVFPLPGNVFVHNRLTHSLEVASVGRSLGTSVGQYLCDNESNKSNKNYLDFYKYELSGVIASACLAHDLGNPAFGHSGEKAISHFFTSHKNQVINGASLFSMFTDDEWLDITNFEGNANALRLLTHTFRGKMTGGMRLMFITLASLIKYPCASSEVDKSIFHKKKYGYFQSDKQAFDDVVHEFNLYNSSNTIIRHPFVYLVEAADDICYRIIDMEDAHRIGLLSRMEIETYFLELIKELNSTEDFVRITDILQRIQDDNEAISYLRTKCIGGLIEEVTEVFKQNEALILNGEFNSTLITEVEKKCPALKRIEAISISRIYNHHSVIEVELAGYNVMSEILNVFVESVLQSKRTPIQAKTIQLLPNQFNLANEESSVYEKVMGIIDFVSGMTDGYATELYRKIKGIEIPSHK